MTTAAWDASPAPAAFDAFAQQYEAALEQGLRVSGEGPQYFAQRRIEWTKRLATRYALGADALLDFGCGVGLATTELANAFAAEQAWGFDPSTLAVDRARSSRTDARVSFTADAASLPAAHFDGVYCNGVFHHIDPAHRGDALQIIFTALRPGGWLALWENNPWNPGTRYVMSRIPFDRDAVTLSPPETRRLLRTAGFRVIRTDAWFLFPRSLRWLRPFESLVHRLPLGAQYLVLAQRPGASAPQESA